MWYEEENKFIRAPTPKSFDNLVQNLENRDSVLFESVALPSAKREETNETQPIEAPSSMMGDLQALDLSEGDSALDFTAKNEAREQLQEEVYNMQKLISQLEFTLREKEAIIEEKDEEISELKKRLKNKNQNQKQSRPLTTNDANQIYKEKYQNVIKELTDLKKSLASQGKVRRVKSRALTHLDMFTPTNKKK